MPVTDLLKLSQRLTPLAEKLNPYTSSMGMKIGEMSKGGSFPNIALVSADGSRDTLSRIIKGFSDMGVMPYVPKALRMGLDSFYRVLTPEEQLEQLEEIRAKDVRMTVFTMGRKPLMPANSFKTLEHDPYSAFHGIFGPHPLATPWGIKGIAFPSLVDIFRTWNDAEKSNALFNRVSSFNGELRALEHVAGGLPSAEPVERRVLAISPSTPKEVWHKNNNPHLLIVNPFQEGEVESSLSMIIAAIRLAKQQENPALIISNWDRVETYRRALITNECNEKGVTLFGCGGEELILGNGKMGLLFPVGKNAAMVSCWTADILDVAHAIGAEKHKSNAPAAQPSVQPMEVSKAKVPVACPTETIQTRRPDIQQVS